MFQPPTLFIVSITVHISYSCFQTLSVHSFTLSRYFVIQLEGSEMVWNQRWCNCNFISMPSPAIKTLFPLALATGKVLFSLLSWQLPRCLQHNIQYRAWNGCTSHLFTEFWVCFSAVISLVSVHWYFVKWMVYIDNRVGASSRLHFAEQTRLVEKRWSHLIVKLGTFYLYYRKRAEKNGVCLFVIH